MTASTAKIAGRCGMRSCNEFAAYAFVLDSFFTAGNSTAGRAALLSLCGTPNYLNVRVGKLC